MKKQILCVILLLTFVFSGCAHAENKRYEASFLDLFDTYTQVVLYAQDEPAAKDWMNRFHDELQQYHRLFDIYNEYDGMANVRTINKNAGIAPVAVDRKIIDLLVFSKEMYEKTGGKVNVAMGSVLSIWHEYREAGIDDPVNAKLPPMADLQEAAEHTDIANVIIDEAAGTVYLADADMSLDVGAIAKGYAVEKVAESMLAEGGVQSALLSVGGNIKAVGTKENGDPWKVGIQNPDMSSDESYIHSVQIYDCSLVTSGSYQRYYTVDGVQYHHIIDPDTLMPATHFVAVTIAAIDSGLADALSTAVYNMSYEQGLHLIESIPGAEAFWVYADGTEQYTEGFKSLITK